MSEEINSPKLGETESKSGRPSKYKPQYCLDLIIHMAEGYSYESFAALINVNPDTLYEWEKVHSEFSEAKKTAFVKNLLFWEKLGIDFVLNETHEEENEEERVYKKTSKSLNPTVWIFNMKNRHKWRDKQKDEVDTVINNNVMNLTDEQLEQRVQDKLKALEGKK